jgi:uridylate kinase
MTCVVLSLGGSVLFPTLEGNTLGAYAPVLQRLAEKVQLFVVVGGGGEARRYIAAARQLGVDEATCDEIGIMVTRLNARLLVSALKGAACPLVPVNHAEALKCAGSSRIVVMGGVTPAQTTDAVAAVLAEQAGAALLVNLTSVDAIYSADPRQDPSAQRFTRLTPVRLLQIVGRGSLAAGSNAVIDVVAARVVQRSGIPLLVLDGRDPRNLERALFSGEQLGTLVMEREGSPLPLKP